MQGQLGAESVSAGRGENRHGEISRPAEQIGLKGLVDALDGPTAFGQADGRLGVFIFSHGSIP
jgi:hypothetical protein